jgi:hypothetical protein
LNEQEVEGNRRLRKYCVKSIETAKKERESRVEEAMMAYQAQLQEEEEMRIHKVSIPSQLSSAPWR